MPLALPPGFVPDEPAAPPAAADLPPGFMPEEPGEEELGATVRASYEATLGVDPDEHSNVIRIADRTGIPPEIVAANPRAAQTHEWDPLQPRPAGLAALENLSPHLKRWASEPRNMAQVRDDLGALSDLEWSLIAPVEALRKGWSSVRAGIASSLHRVGGDLYGLPEAAPFEYLRGIFTGEAQEETGRRVAFEDAMRTAQDLHARHVAARAWIGPFEAAPYLAAGAVSGPVAMAGLGVATTFGPVAERLEALKGPKGETLSAAQVTLGAGAVAAGSGVVFGVGLGPIASGLIKPVATRLPGAIVDRVLTSQTVPALVGRVALRWGSHNALGAASMAAATALEETTVELGQKALDPSHEVNVESIADRTLESFEHAFVGFAAVSAIGPFRQAFHEVGISRLSADQARQIRAAAEALEAAKLPERNPEAAEAFIGTIAPGQTVLVAREAWDTYWQAKRIDPAAKAAELGAEASYQSSVGGFVALPMDRYLARLGKTEHVLGLAADSKLTAEARTPREDAAFQREQKAIEEEAQKARGPEFEREKALVAEIIRAKAEGAQVEASEARAVAELVASTAGSWSLQTGIPVPEVALLVGVQRLRILGPKGETVIRDVQQELRKSLSPAAVAELDAALAGDRRAQARLEARAYVEPLTGLLNRQGFEDYRRHRAPTGWDVAVDANDLGAQDLFGGHAVGDKFLTTVAEAMRAANQATGGQGRLFRWGGDEFHAGGFKTEAQAAAFAKALQERLGGAAELAPGYRASVSMGVGVGPEAADAAAYQAKQAKKAKHGAFSKTEPEKFKGTGGESFIGGLEPANAALTAYVTEPPVVEIRVATVGEAPVVAELRPPRQAQARIITPQKPLGEAVAYRVIEARDLTPSHQPDSFARNPSYPEGVQERDYTMQREEQQKVIRGGDALDPAFLLSDTPSALDGPPIVTGGAKALVLGGNGRSMMFLRGIRKESQRQAYRDELARRAPAFGVDPVEVARMQEPVLVRVVEGLTPESPQGELVAAVRRFNEGMTQALSPRARAVAEAKTLSPTTLTDLGRVLADSAAESLRDLMRDRPGDLLTILRRDGVVTPQNQTEWIRGGGFTEEGKDRLEGIFLGRAVGTTERMNQTASPLLSKLERIAPSLLRVEGVNPGHAETRTVQAAIDLLNDARIRNLTLDQVVAQMGLFSTERTPPEVAAMARLLEAAKPKALQERFEAWANVAAFDPRQASLFGPPSSREQARAALFGMEAVLRQDAPAGGDPRGAIRMRLDQSGKPVGFSIELFQTRDPSTLAHETGHFLSWGMHEIAMDPRGGAVRADYEALLKWAGYGTPEERLAANVERSRLEERADLTGQEKARLRELQAKEERIGHGWEQYLAEGKAPTAALQRVFSRFKDWLLRIYKGLFGIQEQYRARYGEDLRLSDEVRTIFDRWLAAETEVRRVEAANERESADYLAALDPADRAAVERAQLDRRAAAEAEVYTVLREAEREVRSDVRESLRKEIESQVVEEPVYRLLDYLRRQRAPEAGIIDAALGMLDPALLDDHGRPFKLDRGELVALYGEGIVKALPRGTTVAKGGVEADFLAERFGFPTADALVQALKGARPLEAEVEARLDAKLRELYPGAIESPDRVAELAVAAEHSPEAAQEALLGVRILVRKVDPSLGMRLKTLLDGKARKEHAERLVSETRVSELSPQSFLAAERKHAREAMELSAKALRAGKDTQSGREFAAQALDAREAQLVNQSLWRAARDAQVEAQTAREALREFEREPTRRRIAKATVAIENQDGTVSVTQPYLDRIDDLLSTIDLRKSGREAERAARFREWLDQQPQDRRDDILSRVSQRLLSSLEKTRHFGSLTVAEVRELVDAVNAIDAQARLKGKLRLGQKERDFEEVVAGLVETVRERFPGGELRRSEGAESLARRAVVKYRKAKAVLIRPEEVLRELGPAATEALWKPVSDADLEARRLIREVAQPIIDVLDGLSKEQRRFLSSRFVIDGQRLTGENLLALALNWGNDSNRGKVLRGETTLRDRFKEIQPLAPETVEKGLAMLDRPLWELVQTIWDRLDSKWPEIAALEAEFTGSAPPKIEPKAFERTLSDGTTVQLRGGYYPMSYDFRFSTAGQRQGEAISQGISALAFAEQYQRAVTPQGHLQARLEQFARPVELSIRPLPRHVVNAMRDLAMRRALVQTRDLLVDPRIRDAIQDAVGAESYQVLLGHWRDVANETAQARGQHEWLVDWVSARRTAVTGAVFAGNVALAVQNFANVLPALDAVPARYLAKAAARFAVERLDLVERIYAESPTMRERGRGWQEAIGRAMADVVGRQGRASRLAEKVREVGLWMMETTDLATSLPTYLGAKEHALAPKERGGLGMTEAEAIAHAEQTVRLTQSSYRYMDRSAFERSPIFRHFTLFYGYMNAQLSRFLAAHADARLLRHQGFRDEAIRRIVKSYALLMASGVAADLLVGKGPQDYDDDGEITPSDWAQWTTYRALLYPPSTLPIAGSFLQNMAGPGPSRDVSLTPWLRAAEAAVDAIESTQRAAGEDAEADDAYKAGLSALEAFGWYYGLPVVQTRRTGDYWFDITPDGVELSEEAEQAGPVEAAFGTVLGPKREGRLNEALFQEAP